MIKMWYGIYAGDDGEDEREEDKSMTVRWKENKTDRHITLVILAAELHFAP